MFPWHFSQYRTGYTIKRGEDFTCETDQETEIIKEHIRAHRNSVESKIQLLDKFYFPQMSAKIKTIIK